MLGFFDEVQEFIVGIGSKEEVIAELTEDKLLERYLGMLMDRCKVAAREELCSGQSHVFPSVWDVGPPASQRSAGSYPGCSVSALAPCSDIENSGRWPKYVGLYHPWGDLRKFQDVGLDWPSQPCWGLNWWLEI